METASQIPVSVLTGFLGSGKTTVLNRLVRHPLAEKALVVVNEFGEISLDHDLIESVRENTIVLQSGCICCTVRNDLVETLSEAFDLRSRGELPAFDRVLIETTGLADPAPILQTLMTDARATRRFTLDAILTTVDALAGEDTLNRFMEAVRQAAFADRIILTKTDLCEPAALDAIEQRIAALNPDAEIVHGANGNVNPVDFFNLSLHNPVRAGADAGRWFEPRAQRAATPSPGRQEDGGLRNLLGQNRHDRQIESFSVTIDKPLPGEAFDRWLQGLLRIRGPSLLRFKGIINVSGVPGPIVTQGVQHVIYPPVMLAAWPSADRRTRMVFITHGLDRRLIQTSIDELLEAAAGGESVESIKGAGRYRK